jgi:hypothetical protein
LNALFGRLPEMKAEIDELKQQVERLRAAQIEETAEAQGTQRTEE